MLEFHCAEILNCTAMAGQHISSTWARGRISGRRQFGSPLPFLRKSAVCRGSGSKGQLPLEDPYHQLRGPSLFLRHKLIMVVTIWSQFRFVPSQATLGCLSIRTWPLEQCLKSTTEANLDLNPLRDPSKFLELGVF